MKDTHTTYTAKICAHCTEIQPSMKRCSRCKVVHFCCKLCQNKHWPHSIKTNAAKITALTIKPTKKFKLIQVPVQTIGSRERTRGKTRSSLELSMKRNVQFAWNWSPMNRTSSCHVAIGIIANVLKICAHIMEVGVAQTAASLSLQAQKKQMTGLYAYL